MVFEIIKTKEEVNKIIKEFDLEFNPSINSIVDDLDAYSEKLFNSAITVAMKDEDKIIGFSSFYCNDKESGVGFISQIAIKKEYNFKGYGSELINEVETICRNNGMNSLRLEVYKSNEVGLHFYEKNDYKYEKDCSEDSIYMIKEL